MKSKSATKARIYPAPHTAELTVAGYAAIFPEADIQEVPALVGRQLVRPLPPEKAKSRKRTAPSEETFEATVARELNEAAAEYFRVARLEQAGTPSDFVKWSARVSQTAADLLRALGVDPDKPRPLSLAAYAALCLRHKPGKPDNPLTARNHGIKDYRAALVATVASAIFLHDLGAHASRYYRTRTLPVGDRAKRGLSARQVFLLNLARIYQERFDDKVPPHPNPAASPFVRFARWACDVIARDARKSPPPPEPKVRPIADESEGEAARFLDDSKHAAEEAAKRAANPHESAKRADYEAAQRLGKTSKTQIADDVRLRVHALIGSRQYRPALDE